MLPAPLIVRIKHKSVLTVLTIAIFTYLIARHLGYFPEPLSFKRWWWYGNMISYLPSYILGAYIGIVRPNLIVNQKLTITSGYYLVFPYCNRNSAVALFPRNALRCKFWIAAINWDVATI